MAATPGLELSAMGAVRPPAEAVVKAAQRREQQGFDAIWWADHLLHWFPLSHLDARPGAPGRGGPAQPARVVRPGARGRGGGGGHARGEAGHRA